MKKLILVSIILVFVLDATAQSRGRYGRNQGRECIICNVDLGAGWYQPGLDYINDQSFLSDLGGSLDGGPIVTLAIESKIVGGLFAGVSAGYWTSSDKATGDTGAFAGVTEDMTMSIIPVSVYLKYEFPLVNQIRGGYRSDFATKLHPFIGLGTSANLISQDVTRNTNGVVTESNLSGSTQVFQAMFGFKYSVANNVDLGIQGEYVFGGFDQTVVTNEVPADESISLDGIMVQAKLSYTFYNRISQRGSRYSNRYKQARKRTRRRR